MKARKTKRPKRAKLRAAVKTVARAIKAARRRR